MLQLAVRSHKYFSGGRKNTTYGPFVFVQNEKVGHLRLKCTADAASPSGDFSGYDVIGGGLTGTSLDCVSNWRDRTSQLNGMAEYGLYMIKPVYPCGQGDPPDFHESPSRGFIAILNSA